MGQHDRSSRGPVGQAVGVVSALGRAVKQRLGEFAAEADEEIREKLASARTDLEEEIQDAKDATAAEEKQPASE